jgi:ABC-type polysaccharide/polyol phosphate export permease
LAAPFARYQPATVVIDSVRALFEGGPLYHELWQAVVWCSAIPVFFFALSLNRYRRATA